MPERQRRRATVDRDQHLLDLGPVPVQRHRIAARGPAIAEADDAADVFQPERRVEDGQREDHVLAGIHRAVLFDNMFRRDAALNHRRLDDRALG